MTMAKGQDKKIQHQTNQRVTMKGHLTLFMINQDQRVVETEGDTCTEEEDLKATTIEDNPSPLSINEESEQEGSEEGSEYGLESVYSSMEETTEDSNVDDEEEDYSSQRNVSHWESFQNDSFYFNEESKYVLEMEHEHVQVNDAYDLRDLGNDWIPYSDEPIADKEWLLQYNKEQEEKENQEEEFKRRLDGTISLDSW
ncbi:hypothetical protein QZH41_001281 [Actinostola sp. cb2023]|nr:hypothetical protein QZH41_001281 [Actinostola sp. cb2023]